MENKDKDLLKSFVEDNRQEFDRFTPPSMDFSKISKQPEVKKEETTKGKVVPLKWVLRVAAIFVGLVALGGVWMFNSFDNNQVAEVSEQLETEAQIIDFNLADVSTEMAELEGYYIQQVSMRENELAALGLTNELAEELNFLDEEYKALKIELGVDVDNEVIINEMIKNYKYKLELLEQVIETMETLESKASDIKKKKDENNYTIYY